jgi:triphosphoribosyl-dephospho-CoA synthase
MLAYVDLVGEYLAELAGLLRQNAPFPLLVEAGRRAEERMLSHLGTNTHRGAIFLTGLLMAGFARALSDHEDEVRHGVRQVAAQFFAAPHPSASHGAAARREYRVGGIVAEALGGLPTLFEGALPAYRKISLEEGPGRAGYAMMARLMRTVEDTTTLYRGGQLALARLRADGSRVEETISRGKDPVPLLAELNREYRRLNITMGGVADLLGVAFGWLHYTETLAPTPSLVDFSV